MARTRRGGRRYQLRKIAAQFLESPEEYRHHYQRVVKPVEKQSNDKLNTTESSNINKQR